MCGIAGIYNFKTPDLAAFYAESMIEAIACRGPDAHGVKTMDNTVFAHRRLAIIDLDHTADQPFAGSSGHAMITFNGEIYNYHQLRKFLQGKGITFRTNSDTEVILSLYEYGGVDALTRLDGMFALAIYDKRSQTLLLMRDRLGKKPLYYHILPGNEVIFASTLASLKKHPALPREISAEAIRDFLALSYIPDSNSIYKNVQQLPPATYMVIAPDGKTTQHRYWQLDYRNKSVMTFDEAAEVLQEKLNAAVRKRLIADVPCGIFLSGGIDSAITAMLTAQLANKAVDAFTIGFTESKYDERDLAKASIEWINQKSTNQLNHYTKVVDCRSFDTLKKLSGIYGEPFGDFSQLPTFYLSSFASERVKVALSGDGADEIFGGYERYRAMRCAARLDKILPSWVLRMFAASANAVFPDYSKRSKLSRLSRFLRIAATPSGARYAALMLHGNAQLWQKLYGEQLGKLNGDPARFIEKALQNATTGEANERYAECDLHTYLVDDILTKVDRASMANALEVRSPFLDTEVIEFAAALPFEFKQKGSCRKRILKAAMSDALAPTIKNQRKRGFAVPVGQWLRNEWHDLAKQHLLEGKLVNDNWIARNGMNDLLQAHNCYKRDHSELIGNMLMLELFLENE